MLRSRRLVLVLCLATSILVVIPGAVHATVPGAIDEIVFSSTADHSAFELYARDFAGSSPRRLTNNTASDYDAKYSPDGSLLAFNRSASMGFGDIIVMNSDGTGEVNLTAASSALDVFMDWSPDGSWIAYASNGNVWMMRPDGTEQRPLTSNAFEEWEGTFSPDGTELVVNREGELFIVKVDGSGEEPLLLRPERDADPVWSPDGTKIAFVSDQSGFDNIWIMNADGSQPYSLTNTILSNNREPAWAPDGSKIAFSSDRDGDWDIWMMNPDGSDLGHLTNNPADERFVDWESENRDPVVVGETDEIVHRGQSVEVDVLRNDSDPDGEAITVGDIVRMPDEGTVVINGSGTVTYTHDGRTVPSGHAMPYTDSFDYRVDDARMGSAVATVQVWIYPYFDDVPLGHTFFEDVLTIAVQRITFGCNPPHNTAFCPDAFVTRGQMAAFLVRARSYTDGAGADLFTDDNGSIFEDSIDRLGTAGVTKGCNPPDNDRFCPDAYVTRGQMAAFLDRAFGLGPGAVDMFVDDNGSIFEASINALGATGVSRGCNPPDNDRFCPDAYVTRGQMAAFISRALNWALG